MARVQQQQAVNKQKEAELQQQQQILEAERVRQQQKEAARQQENKAQQQKEAELQQLQRALESERVRQHQENKAQQLREAELQQRQRALETERVRQQQKEAELQHQGHALMREREMFESLKREQEAQQRAKDHAAGAYTKAKKDAADAKQAEILEKRHAEGSAYVPTRKAVAAAWEPTKVGLSDCPVHAQPLTPGQSVLLEKCLHAICRDCTPHMIKPDSTVRCPVCQVDSPVKRNAPSPHPFIEAELVAEEARACVTCAPLPEEDRFLATLQCSSCEPVKHYCEGHASAHRKRMPMHAIEQLPHGGAALRCTTHDKLIEAYCTTCSELICMACTLSTHPSATHVARLLIDTAFVEGARDRLVAGVAAARAVAEALLDHATDATVTVSEVDKRDAEIQSEIDRAFNVLVSLLERRRESAHDQRLARTREERAWLQTAREESEHRWRIVVSAADLAEQLATGTHLGVNATAVMVQLEEAATARLNAVLEFKPGRSVPAPTILRFEFGEMLGKRLAEVGRIVQDAP